MIEWDWRVENATSVLFGSSNTRPEIEDGIRGLQGSQTVSVSAFGGVPELVGSFSNGQVLRSMAMTSGDPQWGIRLPSGSWLSARNGALWLDGETEGGTDESADSWNIAENASDRWGIPVAEPVGGKCGACNWFRRLDADFHLLDYGVCIIETSLFDGKVVHRSSGCPIFRASDLV
jgi:hypothetical protein